MACINYDFKVCARDAVRGLLGCRVVLVQTVSQAHNQPRVVVVQAQVPRHTTASDTSVCMYVIWQKLSEAIKWEVPPLCCSNGRDEGASVGSMFAIPVF